MLSLTEVDPEDDAMYTLITMLNPRCWHYESGRQAFDCLAPRRHFADALLGGETKKAEQDSQTSPPENVYICCGQRRRSAQTLRFSALDGAQHSSSASIQRPRPFWLVYLRAAQEHKLADTYTHAQTGSGPITVVAYRKPDSSTARLCLTISASIPLSRRHISCCSFFEYCSCAQLEEFNRLHVWFYCVAK